MPYFDTHRITFLKVFFWLRLDILFVFFSWTHEKVI